MKKFVYNENIDMLEIPADQFAAGIDHARKSGHWKVRVMGGPSPAKARPLDLGALGDDSPLLALNLSGDNIDLKGTDLGPLYRLKQLASLSVPYLRGRIDFSRLVTLDTLHITGADHAVQPLALPALKDLLLVSSRNKDAAFLSGLTGLRKLRISGGRMEQLSGIETLGQLASLRIDHCPALLDIRTVNALPRLATLYVEKCARLRDCAFLADNQTIEALFVSELDSAAFAPRMRKLASLKFWDLKDGDLRPLAASTTLKDVHFHPRKRHYTHSVDELNALLRR